LLQSLYFGLEPLAEKYGFLYAHPDGTLDSSGKRFWNATDACCVFDGADVDDSAYLTGLIDEIGARYNVDPKRVFFLGHSNGGFMSHRMACDHADRIAAIASLAGANFSDSSKCQPNEPVSVLQIHGTADDTILYEGGVIGGASYPGAVQTVEQWATLNGCDLAPQDIAPALDLDEKLPGDETTVSRYAQNCQAGSVVELWTIQGGAHLPQLSPNFGPRVIEFLLAHPKP
jgi:polyhydroxybutyrate depolymerase